MLQRVINLLYRYPLSELKTFKRFGGYFKYRQMQAGRKLMEKASLRLPPAKSHANGLPVYFLTGKKYLYQTLFCIQSLSRVSKTNFKFYLVDDGSFDEQIISRIKQQVPGAVVITRHIIDENLEKHLPESVYPNLRSKRNVYPHLKKLTDIHTIPADDWKLVLDSDMLFWNDPVDLTEWLKSPDKPIHMLDCIENYGYSKNLLEKTAGGKLPQLLNVGVIGLKSEGINWTYLDYWISRLEKAEGGSYYLEQALTAMLIRSQPTCRLSAGSYVVNPADDLVTGKLGVLHHYVDLSKYVYFTSAWRQLIP